MTTALVYVVSFLVTIGVLVVIHELGHYAVARACGVKILRFSVGFGRSLWSRRVGPDATEWTLSAIPLGGYVKMADEREGDVAPEDRPRAFNRQSIAKRILIVLAGPFANFLLAILLYWALFMVGLPGIKPVIAEPPASTPAAAAGLANGDVIVAIGGEPTPTWSDVRFAILGEAVKHGSVAIEVETAGGTRSERSLDLASVTKDDLDRDFLAKLGLNGYRPNAPAVLGKVMPGSAAEAAHLQLGDRVVAIDGRPTATWFDFTAAVSSSGGREILLEVEREGHRFEVKAIPQAVGEGAKRVPRLGVEAGEPLKREYERMATTVRYGPIEAMPHAVRKVVDLSAFSLKMLGRMVVGDVSWKNLSGPITIADYAGQSAQLGWITYLGFLALVSVSLGVLNLLPIPLLDGGHLVYYFAEIVKGSPVSEKTMEIGQRLGLAVLLGLTFFAFYNDINRLFTG